MTHTHTHIYIYINNYDIAGFCYQCGLCVSFIARIGPESDQAQFLCLKGTYSHNGHEITECIPKLGQTTYDLERDEHSHSQQCPIKFVCHEVVPGATKQVFIEIGISQHDACGWSGDKQVPVQQQSICWQSWARVSSLTISFCNFIDPSDATWPQRIWTALVQVKWFRWPDPKLTYHQLSRLQMQCWVF